MTTASTNALDALTALLAGRGHRLWLTGASARQRLLPSLPAATGHEVVTEAPEADLKDALATLAEMTPGPCRVDARSLGETPLDEWLGRRGVTIDAMAVATADDSLTDPHGGHADLLAGVLRTNRPADVAFREDPLLLLRVPRLVATTGLVPAVEVRRYAARDAGNLLDVRARRPEWAQELNAMLLGTHVERALQHLHDTRVLPILMPEVAAMVGFDKSCAVHHKDIWEHTKLVTQKAQPDLVVRWTALCHDIGKVWTRSVNRSGKVHFFRHEELGALLFEGVAHRVGLDPELSRRVAYVIENHSRVNLYRDDWSDSAVRRLVRETIGHLPDLVAFSKADFTTKREAKIAELKRQMVELEERLLRIDQEDARVPPLAKGIGSAIMVHFGLGPSRVVGELKALLEAAIEAGTLPPRADDAVYLAWLETEPSAQVKLGRG